MSGDELTKQVNSMIVNYCQSPEQKQSAVHLRAALKHLHLPVHPFLQPHRISSEHDCDASGRVVHNGCHPVSTFFHPQSAGLGRSGSGIKAWFSSNWTGSRPSEHVVPELLKLVEGFPGSSTCG